MKIGPWRSPAEDSDDIYPNLSVCDNRVSGSIVIDHSRLPLWAITGELCVGDGWRGVESGWSPGEHYEWTDRDMAGFLGSLLNVRGEFARLLLVLADEERREAKRGFNSRAWWDRPRRRKRVADQLRRCIECLEVDA